MRYLLLSLLLLAGCDLRPSNWYSADLVAGLQSNVADLQHENDSLRVELAAKTITYIQNYVVIDRSDITAPVTIQADDIESTRINGCNITMRAGRYWSDTTYRPMAAVNIGQFMKRVAITNDTVRFEDEDDTTTP